MLFYVYFDRHGYSGEVCTEEELERRYNKSPDEMKNYNDDQNQKTGRMEKIIRPNHGILRNLLDRQDCRTNMRRGMDCYCGCHHGN
jgi:hypothetical protein